MSDAVTAGAVDSLRAALAEETGLRFDDDKEVLLADLLSARTRATGAGSVAAYVDRLTSLPEELAELVRELSVPETYFLRNRDQFRVLEAFIRRRAETSSHRLRVLSAGCSTGEEAYSVAISTLEAVEAPKSWDVSVLGVDLNPDAIGEARRNSYSRWSMRATPETILRRYFRQSGTHFSVVDAACELVRFQQVNILRPPNGFWRPSTFDVVMCRNVLMYMTPFAAREIVANVARALRPGGFLFLGHAENLRGLSHDFHLRRSHGTFYYQLRSSSEVASEFTRDAPEVRAAEPWSATPSDASWFETISEASSRIESLSRAAGPAAACAPASPVPIRSVAVDPAPDHLSPAIELLRQERFQDALRLLADVPNATASRPDALLLRAVLLVSTGDVAGAVELCEELLAVDDLNAAAHYIMAICLEHAGDDEGAVEHDKIATYLDSDFAMPHLQLGRLARRAGRLATARRELELALGLLARQDAAAILLFGGGFNREALTQICSAELVACGGMT